MANSKTGTRDWTMHIDSLPFRREENFSALAFAGVPPSAHSRQSGSSITSNHGHAKERRILRIWYIWYILINMYLKNVHWWSHIWLYENLCLKSCWKHWSSAIQNCSKPKEITNGNHTISFSAGNLRNESKQSLLSRYVHIDCIEAAFRARGLLWKTR